MDHRIKLSIKIIKFPKGNIKGNLSVGKFSQDTKARNTKGKE